MTTTQWWRDAVIYQIYPRSFADANGDAYGDLAGIISRLDYLVELGVDAVWLSPFYLSPMADAGYDVADYETIDPLFGSNAEAEALIERAHELGLKVIIDLVPNHTSDQHRWFQAAIAAEPGSPEREMYLFRDGTGPDGTQPPNNWKSVFGGNGWTRLRRPDGSPEQWYLHIFDVHQPDLNWESERVREAFDAVLRHWLDRGVDGFRVDVAHSLVKAAGLPDEPAATQLMEGQLGPQWNQPGVHDVYRRWREVLDTYDGDRALVAEAWVPNPAELAKYVRPDEMNQAFNFDFLTVGWDAARYREVIDTTMAANAAVGAPTTWVLSNHDVVRHRSRLGRATPNDIDGYGAEDPQADDVLGLARARAATLLMLALPGSAYLYQGEELGLPEHGAVPDDLRQDPVWFRSQHTRKGRDGCRIPLPWAADEPGLGFSPTGATWLPQPESYRALSVDRQQGVTGSTWELYHQALRLRREHDLGQGSVAWQPSDPAVLSFDNGSVRVIVNLGASPVSLPAGHSIALASSDIDGTVPPNAAVWLTR